MKLTHTKTRGMSLPHGENFAILTSPFLTDPPVLEGVKQGWGRKTTKQAIFEQNTSISRKRYRRYVLYKITINDE